MSRPKGSKNRNERVEEMTLEVKNFVRDILTVCFREGIKVKAIFRNGFGELNEQRTSWEVKRPIYSIDGVRYNLNKEEDRRKLISYICSYNLPKPTKTIDLTKTSIRKGDRI